MHSPRTVSDTKKAFYTAHTRPIHSIFRRFVEELLVEIHLLRVNAGFVYNPLFALGVVTAYNQFMAAYRPEAERDGIFQALCLAEEFNPETLKADALRWQDLKGSSLESSQAQIKTWLQGSGDPWQNTLGDTIQNNQAKYNRLSAIGLYQVLELLAGDLTLETSTLESSIDQLAPVFNLPVDKVKKDLELYRSNLEKMHQAQKLLAEIAETERKRREQPPVPAGVTEPAPESESTSAEASS